MAVKKNTTAQGKESKESKEKTVKTEKKAETPKIIKEE